MEGLKKEKVKSSRGSGEMGWDVGGDDVTRSLSDLGVTTKSTNSKKRVKLNGKIGDLYGSVVPRRLRSALCRRSNESASKPVLSLKRNWSSSSNGVKKFTERMSGPLTEDEEEVIKVLSTLASIVVDTTSSGDEMARKSSDRNTELELIDSKSVSAVASENPKAEDMQSPLTSAGPTSASTQCGVKVKPLVGMPRLDPPISMVQSSIQNIDLGLNMAAETCNKGPCVLGNTGYPVKSDGIVNSSHQHDTLTHDLHSSGKLEITQLGKATKPKSDVEVLPLMQTSETKKQEITTLKEQDQGATSDRLNAVPSTSACGDLTRPLSTKASVGPHSTQFDATNLRGDNPMAEKALLSSKVNIRSHKKCATHVYVSHLIRDYQQPGKNHKSPLTHLANPSKLGNMKELGISANTTTNSQQNGPSCSSRSDRCKSNIGTRHDRLAQPDCNHPTVNSQMTLTHDFLTSSVCRESFTRNFGRNRESHGGVSVPYLNSLPPQHNVAVPYSLHPSQYTTPYPDQIAAQQLPRYICHPIYGIPTDHARVPTSHQQQQMWQAHLAHYRAPTVTTKFHHSKRQDQASTSSSAILSSVNSTVGPRSGNQQQFLPLSFLDAVSHAKKHHQPAYYNHLSGGGGALRPEAPPPPCNVQHI